MPSSKKLAANRANSKLSTGPSTLNGKKYSSKNSRKHGFFSKEVSLSDVEKEELETLISKLEEDLSPTTTLQHLALRDIAWCIRRGTIALMLEAKSAESLLEQAPNAETDTSVKPPLPKAFYASSPQDLRIAVSWLKGICEDFHENHVLREDWKSNFDTLFGPLFFPSLTEWNAASECDVQLAMMLNAKRKAYRMGLPQELEGSMKTPTLVLDPLQNAHLKEKLLDLQLRHMQEFLSTWQQRAQANPEANPRIVDFSPRYYTAASRDLHRAVDWYRKLKESGM
jgi:hypothetical protein